MPEQEDPSPRRQKLTVAIPHRRKSVRFATLRPKQTSLPPSGSTAAPRPNLRSAGTRTKGTAALGVAREHYGRKADWQRRMFTKLHGRIRCLFCTCARNASPNPGLQPCGTINRLPDAAARHLRNSCAHFEESEMYKAYRDSDKGGRMSREEIVAQVVRAGEKIAVAQVFCRKDKAHRRRCAEIELGPLDVEERLGRHALLCKAGDCECCPHPSFPEWLSAVSGEADVKMEEEGEGDVEDIPEEGRKKKKRKLMHSVPGQLVYIKQEEEDGGIPDTVPVQTFLKRVPGRAEKERIPKRNLKRKAPDDDDDDQLEEDDEAEVAILLERIRV